jgi:uncharacterized protein YjbJ (UPF0337 family)
MHLSVIDKAASRAPKRQILKARTNGDNALDGRTRSAFWAAGRPTRSSCGFGHHGLLTGLEDVEGNWKEVKGKVKEKWAKLTDDDLTAINGQRDQLEGRLQKRYGYAKDQARKDVDTWFSTLK